MAEIPGRVPVLLADPDIALFRAEDRVFDAMVDGWRTQMLARGLTVGTISGRCAVVTRFQSFTNEYPWKWNFEDIESYLATLRGRGGDALSLTTLRSYSNAIGMFCGYVADSRYGWVALCDRTFGDVPVQICFEWNSPHHTADDAVPPKRRSFTKSELQTLFDCVDDFVDAEYAEGSKRWLPALRDSIAFKVAYAYGLRRQELAKLELHDFGPNPHVPQYGRFGALQVRWAKGTAGSGPRRRTVLTSPEFDWVVPLLEYWTSPLGRGRFATSARSAALWPSERDAIITPNSLGASFTSFRALAGLPSGLGLHCLRHSHVTHQLEAGYDPTFVQLQVGHKNSSTTALYTSVSSDFKQRSIQQMIERRLSPSSEEIDE
ncbi:MAG: site-specific integrase [Demequinaceae bacterium]|nr:site-specific integrase [Demequinaceae bacterium]